MTPHITHRRRDLGFTLIELLVVISIIGILSSVTMASLNSARRKAKEAKYVQNLSQIRNAIALYASTNGKVPYEGQNYWLDDYDGNTSLRDGLAPLVTGKFIPAISTHPDWPRNGDSYTQYITAYSGSTYGRFCGTFNSFDEAARSGQKGVLLAVDYSANPLNARLQTLSYCYDWGGGSSGCWQYGSERRCLPL